MSIHINHNANLKETIDRIHYMPCRINSNGEANVSKYFEPYICKTREEVLKGSFRGRPLFGKLVEFPYSYQGIVVQEMKQPLSEKSERNMYVTHSFKSMNYWNWGKHPSDNDAFLKALEWIDIAEVLHSSGTEE